MSVNAKRLLAERLSRAARHRQARGAGVRHVVLRVVLGVHVWRQAWQQSHVPPAGSAGTEARLPWHRPDRCNLCGRCGDSSRGSLGAVVRSKQLRLLTRASPMDVAGAPVVRCPHCVPDRCHLVAGQLMAHVLCGVALLPRAQATMPSHVVPKSGCRCCRCTTAAVCPHAWCRCGPARRHEGRATSLQALPTRRHGWKREGGGRSVILRLWDHLTGRVIASVAAAAASGTWAGATSVATAAVVGAAAVATTAIAATAVAATAVAAAVVLAKGATVYVGAAADLAATVAASAVAVVAHILARQREGLGAIAPPLRPGLCGIVGPPSSCCSCPCCQAAGVIMLFLAAAAAAVF